MTERDAEDAIRAGVAAHKLWLPGMDKEEPKPSPVRNANWTSVEAFRDRDRNTPVTLEDRGGEYRWVCVQHGQPLFEAKTLDGALYEIEYADLHLLTLDLFDEPEAVSVPPGYYRCDCNKLVRDDDCCCQCGTTGENWIPF